MAGLPSGTLTLLFSDIEGSTRLLDYLGRERFSAALDAHRRIVREEVAGHGGVEVDTQGDAFFCVFTSTKNAVAACAAIQRAHARHDWPEGTEVRVRIGLHTGEPLHAGDHYVGMDVHRGARLMSAGHGGQVLLSQSTADLVADELPDRVALRDLGEHRLKDLSRDQRLYDLLIDDVRSEFPVLRTLKDRPTNLPIQVNRLVGRTEELAAITGRLREREDRLLTLTGPGGIGKTRLALHAGAELAEAFADGVFFVPLAPVHNPSLLLATVAQTLRLREQAGQNVGEAVHGFLAGKDMLLLLDNFEQIVEAATDVSRLLAAAPDVSLLVTSRQRLWVAGEHAFPVPALGAPAGDERLTRAEALKHDAVTLFLDRARAARPDFELTEEDAGAMATICARLDGLPLAIELAAARVRVLAPKAILRRLDESLRLLTGGTRDADERQRTLRATIAWSYDLLSEEEMALFARLSVFAGGCRLDAAAAVCDPNGDLGIDVLDGLSSLEEKSLLRRRDDPDAEPRFWMLETIREYAAEQLRARADDSAARHAAWFAGVAARSDIRAEPTSVALLRNEHANFRAALAFFHERGEITNELELAANLIEYGFQVGTLTETRAWLENALSRGQDAPGDLRALAFSYGAMHAAFQGDLAAGRQHADNALALTRGAGQPALLAEALRAAAVVADVGADAEAARRLYGECLEIARELNLTAVIADVTNNLGYAALTRGDLDGAERLLRETVAAARARQDLHVLTVALNNLALTAIEGGRPGEATPLVREALEVAARYRFVPNAAVALELVAALMVEAGLLRPAAETYGAAAGLCEQPKLGRPMEDRLRERCLAAAGEGLGQDELEAARARGSALAADDAIERALSWLDDGPTANTVATVATGDRSSP
jgi:predicted ATPase/class 3 adenylate cyclase